MDVREHRPDGAFNHVDHPLLRQRVRDRQTDRTGTLMAVLRDPVGTVSGRQQYARTAYIRDAGGMEFTAASGSVEPA